MSAERITPARIYTPTSLSELLSYYRDHPKAVPFAGGTYLYLTRGGSSRLGNELLDLTHVPELAQISRTEQYMEIGTVVPINKIMNTGRHVMPKALYEALSSIGGTALRNQATLGGNLCARRHRLTAYTVLLLLDVRLELRRAGGTRWINLNRFISAEGEPLFERGELVTRIRIPFIDWDVEKFRRQEKLFSPDHFIFCGVAQKQKDVISDLRTSFCVGNREVIRARKVEAELIGRKLPISEDDGKTAAQMLQHQVERNSPDLDSFHLHRIRKSLIWFLGILNDSV